MTEKDGDKQRHMWEEGWEGHEKAQLLRMAALSFEEKIRWLEEAQEKVRILQKD
jgi:hypothetical protein